MDNSFTMLPPINTEVFWEYIAKLRDESHEKVR